MIGQGEIASDEKVLYHPTTGIGLRSWQLLAGIIVLAFVHGLLYLLVVPPWQHPDEPKHFEYVWLAAHLPHWPHPSDQDQNLNRLVMKSMVANHFYGNANTPVIDSAANIAIEGYSQLDEPPLYYFLASQSLKYIQFSPIETQLRVARLVSLCFFLLTVLSAWGIARELTPPGSYLRWVVPLFLALLPGFVDAMTAVNNDSAAVGIASLFLWGSVRLLKQRSWVNLLWVLLSAGFAFLSKNTAYFALPLAVLVILISSLPVRRRWIGWGIAMVGVAIALLIMLEWGNAANWYARGGSRTQDRIGGNSPLGTHALMVHAEGKTQKGIQQLLSPETSRSLEGKTVTLGAWMWATRPVSGYLAQFQWFNKASSIYAAPVEVGVKPEFHAFAFNFQEQADRSWVTLGSGFNPGGQPVDVYFDGVVLLEGEWSDDQPPAFGTTDGGSGLWFGRPFKNLLRNGSAESGWPYFRPQVESVTGRAFSDPSVDNMTVALYTVLDPKTTGWYYYAAARSIFHTFWGMFGWGHVPLIGHKPYRLVGILTLLGLAGAVVVMLRKWSRLNWSAIGILGIALISAWGLALVRGTNYLLIPIRVYLPVARYVFPAVIPSVLILCAGWLQALKFISKVFRLPPVVSGATILLGLATLDIYALVSLVTYYGPFYG